MLVTCPTCMHMSSPDVRIAVLEFEEDVDVVAVCCLPCYELTL